MKSYFDRSYAGEFDVTSNLYLEDDGRFSYSEYYSCYGAAFEDEVRGTWRKSGDAIFLRVELVGETMNSSYWVVGQERRAIEREDENLDFGGGFTMLLEHDEADQIQPSKEAINPEETINPDDKNRKPPPTIARLHFKDGRILEKQLPNDSLFGLVNVMYYRLVDENGNPTNIFAPRQNSSDSDSQVIDYDEITIGGE